MPLAPAIWLNDFVVNLTITGSQLQPRITPLAIGNFRVSRVAAANGPIGRTTVAEFSSAQARIGKAATGPVAPWTKAIVGRTT
jgi:hypothetical protein